MLILRRIKRGGGAKAETGGTGIRTFPWTYSPAHSPSRIIPALFLHGADISSFRHHRPPIYNIKRSTVIVFKIDRGRSIRVSNAGVCQFSKKTPPRESVKARIPRASWVA